MLMAEPCFCDVSTERAGHFPCPECSKARRARGCFLLTMIALFGAFGVRIDGEQNSGASWDQGRHNPDHNLCLVAFGVDVRGVKVRETAGHSGGADAGAGMASAFTSPSPISVSITAPRIQRQPSPPMSPAMWRAT